MHSTSPPKKRPGIRFDPRKHRQNGKGFHVRVLSDDMHPPEPVLGWFSKPEDAYETADRAFVNRFLRTGKSFNLNEPGKTDRYLGEEATTLRDALKVKQDAPGAVVQQPTLWFLYHEDPRWGVVEDMELFDDVDLMELFDEVDLRELSDDLDVELLAG